jgi:transcriptional regulator with XRE-family HTH domain
MDRTGPRIRANRKEQKILLSLLRAIRTDAGLRQTDMAEALKVPQSYVSKYESGERRLDPLELRAVCKAAGISLTVFGRRLDELLDAQSAPVKRARP